MKKKIEEKTKKLQQIIEAINNNRNQTGKLEQEALMVQGEIRVLKELEQEGLKNEESKEEVKDTLKK